MNCPLCHRRRARRQCPALGQQICAVCCGTKRLVEIRCPADCGYLSASRVHPPAAVQRQQQRDFTALAPLLQGLTEPQSRLLLVLGSLIARHTPQDFQSLCDEDIAEAAGAVAATLETAGRGVIYEHRAKTRPAQHLAEELKKLLTEVSRDPHALRAPTTDDGLAGTAGVGESPRIDQKRLERDAALALRRLEQGARAGSGGSATAYRDLLGRLFDSPRPGDAGGTPPPRSRLIVP